MLYFDMDGVLRDLCCMANLTSSDWNVKINRMTFYKYFDTNRHLLRDAPPTEYVPVVKKYFNEINIISHQTGDWQPIAVKWTEEKLPEIKCNLVFDKDKLHLLGDDDLIVEDYPFFDDYSKVVLIDRPYNQNVQNPYMRVKTPYQLEMFIKAYKLFSLLKADMNV